MKLSRMADCKIISLPTRADPRGNLAFIESNQCVPFDIKRVYYVYEVPSGTDRGGHAHKDLEQFVIAVSGSFEITVDDGKDKKAFVLNNANFGLYIPRMIWRDLKNFSTNSICLVLASDHYKKDDYIRDYEMFKLLRSSG